MSSTIARGTLYRQYSRGSSGGSSENLPPKTLQRVAREIRDLHKNRPEGVRLVVDAETGVPGSLGEVLVRMLGRLDARNFQLAHAAKGLLTERRNTFLCLN